ncbi:MAG: hypothetical protein MJ142_01930 [Clostridia bacterium]|nr:hypothetical protein [Clostridia bacterium]
MLNFAFIGQDIPTLFPTLLTDLLFVGREPACLRVEERNQAMADLLQGYGDAILKKAGIGGSLNVTGDRAEALEGADCVIYAGDPFAASRFFQDRSALGGDEEDENDPGLTDQARVNGGIGGLMHTLRAGEYVLQLCDKMDSCCPGALIINLGQPVARTTELFESRGYRCCGLGRTPLRGTNGLDTLAKRLRLKEADVEAEIAGLPGFAFLLSAKEAESGRDLLPQLKQAAESGELGSLAKRWLSWWDALPAGDVTDHAEFLPAQPDFIPDEHPEFGETVEKRKDRILYMNTVRDQGADAREGAMAQLLLLSKAPPVRPMRLALALLRNETCTLPAVTRKNGGVLPQLSGEAVIEAALTLDNGKPVTDPLYLPAALADIMTEVDMTNRLAARAAAGDRSALRACIETDPALDGLDRIYCQELVDRLIELHNDIIERL